MKALVLFKPDCFERDLQGTLVGYLLKKYEFSRVKNYHLTPRRFIEEHYQEHKDKEFYEELVDFMSDGHTFAIELENKFNPEQTILNFKKDVKAIREFFDCEGCRNLIHASDSEEAAKREIELWFV